MNDTTDVLVVGAGPAGVAAAIQARRLGHSVHLVDSAGTCGGLVVNAYEVQNCPMTPVPAPGYVLVESFSSNLRRWGIAVERVRVLSLSLTEDGAVVAHTEGAPLMARSVIVATGTRPRTLGVPGEEELEGRALWYEPHQAMAALRDRTTVAIVGGGEAAFDYALTSSRRFGLGVRLLVRGRSPRASGWLRNEVLSDPSIEVLTSTPVEALERYGRGVLLHTPSGPIQADAILVAIGRVPSLPEGATRLAHRPNNRIVGDAARGSLGQATAAAGDGLVAAMEVSRWLLSR